MRPTSAHQSVLPPRTNATPHKRLSPPRLDSYRRRPVWIRPTLVSRRFVLISCASSLYFAFLRTAGGGLLGEVQFLRFPIRFTFFSSFFPPSLFPLPLPLPFRSRSLAKQDLQIPPTFLRGAGVTKIVLSGIRGLRSTYVCQGPAFSLASGIISELRRVFFDTWPLRLGAPSPKMFLIGHTLLDPGGIRASKLMLGRPTTPHFCNPPNKNGSHSKNRSD